jgi:hypothetical protein
MASIPELYGLQDLSNVVFTRLEPYSHGGRFQYISRHASEVRLLEGLTVKEAWEALERNSHHKKCRGQVNYSEWCASVSQGMDPRFAFDYLFNLFSKRFWFHETRTRNMRAWKKAWARVRETYDIADNVEGSDRAKWIKESLYSIHPRLPTLRQDPHFIAIWRCFPGLNFSDLDVVLRNSEKWEWADERLWFLYDQTATVQRILERTTFNDLTVRRLIVQMAIDAMEEEYHELILNIPAVLEAEARDVVLRY